MDSSDSFSDAEQEFDPDRSGVHLDSDPVDRLTDSDSLAPSGDAEVHVDPFAFDEAASEPFVGQWNQLVSRTNWDKGRIIFEWREALIDASAPATTYSDEAWAQLVGGVTGQHVGRLRRVYQRFHTTYESYEGLYWTHFQGALDWDDAEMWLEGAVRESWSVSKMRKQRWETLGALPEQKPADDDIVVADLDEDFEPALKDQPASSSAKFDESTAGPRSESPDFGDEQQHFEESDSEDSGAAIYASDVDDSIDFVRPFENLKDLPEDLAESFESFKLAIIRHKAEGWAEVPSEDVLASLDALKALVYAPSGDE